MPQRVRTTGFSARLRHGDGDLRRLHARGQHALRSKLTGDRAAPALWLSLAAAISLSARCLSRRLVATPGLQAGDGLSRCFRPQQRSEKMKAVIRAGSGNFLELYDFLVYVYFATYIAKAFFPPKANSCR